MNDRGHPDRPDRVARWLLAGALAGVACAWLGPAVVADPGRPSPTATAPPATEGDDDEFAGQRAYRHLRRLCDLGPRPSGSDAMHEQRELVASHFESLGGAVHLQRFRAPHPVTGRPVSLANLVCQWHADRAERILLCAHYDTRPLPDRDRNPLRRRNGRFIGANDGASGVALLMEMGRHMPPLDSRYGVDFALLDGEEFVYDETDSYFLGSHWFARKYAREPPDHVYRWGVLVDMVGDANLQIFQERHSMAWKDTRPLVLDIWSTAERLGVRQFIGRRRYQIRDDHLPLHDVAKIPTCVIIDFDYPYWHTEGDTADKCSARSLARVGTVVLEWLRTVD